MKTHSAGKKTKKDHHCTKKGNKSKLLGKRKTISQCRRSKKIRKQHKGGMLGRLSRTIHDTFLTPRQAYIEFMQNYNNLDNPTRKSYINKLMRISKPLIFGRNTVMTKERILSNFLRRVVPKGDDEIIIINYLINKSYDLNLRQPICFYNMEDENRDDGTIISLLSSICKANKPKTITISALLNNLKDFKIEAINFKPEYSNPYGSSNLLNDFTPLMWLCFTNAEDELIKHLIDAGANVNLTTKYGITALDLACNKTNIRIATLLLAAGAKVSTYTLLSVLTTIDDRLQVQVGKILDDRVIHLMQMFQGRDPDSFKTLVVIGWAYSHRKLLVCACAMLGAEPLKITLIELLIQNGADVNKMDYDNFSKTALNVAFEKKEFEVANFLIDKGATIFTNYDKDTILMAACKNNGLEVVKKLLIRDDVDVNLKNRNNKTAFSFACENNNFEIVKLLIEHIKSKQNNENPNLLNEYINNDINTEAIKSVYNKLISNTILNIESNEYKIMKYLKENGSVVSKQFREKLTLQELNTILKEEEEKKRKEKENANDLKQIVVIEANTKIVDHLYLKEDTPLIDIIERDLTSKQQVIFLFNDNYYCLDKHFFITELENSDKKTFARRIGIYFGDNRIIEFQKLEYRFFKIVNETEIKEEETEIKEEETKTVKVEKTKFVPYIIQFNEIKPVESFTVVGNPIALNHMFFSKLQLQPNKDLKHYIIFIYDTKPKQQYYFLRREQFSKILKFLNESVYLYECDIKTPIINIYKQFVIGPADIYVYLNELTIIEISTDVIFYKIVKTKTFQDCEKKTMNYIV